MTRPWYFFCKGEPSRGVLFHSLIHADCDLICIPYAEIYLIWKIFCLNFIYLTRIANSHMTCVAFLFNNYWKILLFYVAWILNESNQRVWKYNTAKAHIHVYSHQALTILTPYHSHLSMSPERTNLSRIRCDLENIIFKVARVLLSG